MILSMHALFDDDTRAHEALATLQSEGLADPCVGHRCTYDRPEYNPSFLESAAPLYAVVGSFVMAHVGAGIGLFVAFLGASELGYAPSALLGGLAGASGGALTFLLAGSGALRPDLEKAGKRLRPGRLLMSFAPPSGVDFERVALRLRELGALAVDRGAPGAI